MQMTAAEVLEFKLSETRHPHDYNGGCDVTSSAGRAVPFDRPAGGVIPATNFSSRSLTSSQAAVKPEMATRPAVSGVTIQDERAITIPSDNYFDIAEIALIEVSKLQRMAWNDRWIGILVDAGETELADELAAEMRCGIMGAGS